VSNYLHKYRIGQSPLAPRNSDEVPDAIRFFNGLIGCENVKNRIQRVNDKLVGLSSASPFLEDCFLFHRGLSAIYTRLKLNRPVQLDVENRYRTVAFISAIQDAWEILTPSARIRFRNTLLRKLSPDEDVREIEHELRCYAHLRRNGCSVLFADYEGIGQLDF
jgi:hypothetical protein